MEPQPLSKEQATPGVPGMIHYQGHRALNYIFMKAYQVATIQDIVRYWRQCLDDATPDDRKQAVAGWVVGIHNSDMDFDEFYDDPNFEKLLSAAEELEIMKDDDYDMDHFWQKIIEALPELEKKYL
jgi:hypothetical protein